MTEGFRMKKIHVVYSLITDDTRTKILMVRNADNGQWTLPGGAVEDDESLEAAAIREAKEEMGYDIRVHGIVAVNEAVLLESQEHALLVTFRAEVVGGSPAISRPDEIQAIDWIDIDKSDDLMPYYKDGLQNIVNQRIEVAYFNEGVVT
jgi:8-oxo-dGTP diphosphatase